MKRVLALIAFGLIVASPAFAGLRCGTKLVSEGDTSGEVAAKCGEPTDVVRMKSVFRRPVIWVYGRPQYIGEDYIEIPVEAWVYNLGPNKLMRRLVFEDGVVSKIETLGYGYN
jgi:uncharacterized protein DUF2845